MDKRSALYIFLVGLFLVLIYTFFVWLEKKYSLDKRVIEFFRNLRLKKFDRILLVNSYLFILAIIIFASVTMLINTVKLLNPLLVILSILISSVIVFLLVMIQKNPKEPLRCEYLEKNNTGFNEAVREYREKTRPKKTGKP